MAKADDKSSTSDKVSTSIAVDEEIADLRSRRLTSRSSPFYVLTPEEVAEIFRRGDQFKQQEREETARWVAPWPSSSAGDEEIADPLSRKLIWREAWWPLAVAVAWVLLRSQQVVEQLLNLHSRVPITFRIVDIAAHLKAGGQHTTPKFENSDAAFDELRHPLETGEIEIAGTDFIRVGDLGGSARSETGKQQTIPSSEMSSLIHYDDYGELCLIPRDWRAAHGSTRTNLCGYCRVQVRSAALVGRFPEETEQLAHVPSDAVVRETDAEVPAPSMNVPAASPTPPRMVPASAQWAITTTRRLQDESKIPEGMRKAELARLLATESEKAVKAGQIKRALLASYLENQLVPWGIWPLSSSK